MKSTRNKKKTCYFEYLNKTKFSFNSFTMDSQNTSHEIDKPIDLQNIELTDRSTFKDLETNLLIQLKSQYEVDKRISDDLLDSLYFIYKSPLLEALNQIDKLDQRIDQQSKHKQAQQTGENSLDNNLVTVISCLKFPNRSIYKVLGSNGFNYYLYESLRYCGCQSFKYNVLNRNEFVYCKHMILIKFIKAMNRLVSKTVSETELLDLIKQI